MLFCELFTPLPLPLFICVFLAAFCVPTIPSSAIVLFLHALICSSFPSLSLPHLYHVNFILLLPVSLSASFIMIFHCGTGGSIGTSYQEKGRVSGEVRIGQARRGRAQGGERPIGAASCRQQHNEVSCQIPVPPSLPHPLIFGLFWPSSWEMSHIFVAASLCFDSPRGCCVGVEWVHCSSFAFVHLRDTHSAGGMDYHQ